MRLLSASPAHGQSSSPVHADAARSHPAETGPAVLRIILAAGAVANGEMGMFRKRPRLPQAGVGCMAAPADPGRGNRVADVVATQGEEEIPMRWIIGTGVRAFC